ncbi:hypothetical protein AAHA92_17240 [Salvia divinorum]|uniref:Uncharacterized protein n=1 Tax=Salvia divinorum TaxID=28513 RepID=A0ABD1GY59_SALDI
MVPVAKPDHQDTLIAIQLTTVTEGTPTFHIHIPSVNLSHVLRTPPPTRAGVGTDPASSLPLISLSLAVSPKKLRSRRHSLSGPSQTLPTQADHAANTGQCAVVGHCCLVKPGVTPPLSIMPAPLSSSSRASPFSGSIVNFTCGQPYIYCTKVMAGGIECRLSPSIFGRILEGDELIQLASFVVLLLAAWSKDKEEEWLMG